MALVYNKYKYNFDVHPLYSKMITYMCTMYTRTTIVCVCVLLTSVLYFKLSVQKQQASKMVAIVKPIVRSPTSKKPPQSTKDHSQQPQSTRNPAQPPRSTLPSVSELNESVEASQARCVYIYCHHHIPCVHQGVLYYCVFVLGSVLLQIYN